MQPQTQSQPQPVQNQKPPSMMDLYKSSTEKSGGSPGGLGGQGSGGIQQGRGGVTQPLHEKQSQYNQLDLIGTGFNNSPNMKNKIPLSTCCSNNVHQFIWCISIYLTYFFIGVVLT